MIVEAMPKAMWIRSRQLAFRGLGPFVTYGDIGELPDEHTDTSDADVADIDIIFDGYEVDAVAADDDMVDDVCDEAEGSVDYVSEFLLLGLCDFTTATYQRVIAICDLCPSPPTLSLSALNMLCVVTGGLLGAVANDEI